MPVSICLLYHAVPPKRHDVRHGVCALNTVFICLSYAFANFGDIETENNMFASFHGVIMGA